MFHLEYFLWITPKILCFYFPNDELFYLQIDQIFWKPIGDIYLKLFASIFVKRYFLGGYHEKMCLVKQCASWRVKIAKIYKIEILFITNFKNRGRESEESDIWHREVDNWGAAKGVVYHMTMFSWKLCAMGQWSVPGFLQEFRWALFYTQYCSYTLPLL